MGKKAQSSEPAPAPPAQETASSTLAEAIRNALEEKGYDATRTEVAEWIKRNQPNMDYKDTTLNSSLSSIRKKLKGEGEASSAQDPTVADLMKVKTLAEEQGGVDELLAQIEKVESLAKKIGGLPRLRECLDGLKQLKT